MKEDYVSKVIKDYIETKPEVIDIIGYGSAVKKQNRSNEKLEKQIDVIVTVEDTKKWHEENYKINPKDYASKLGYLYLTKRPRNEEKRIYINYLTYLENNGHKYKLGVISKKQILEDLYSWKNCYLAGRMQKPIAIIKSDESLNNAIMANRLNALRAALMSLSNTNPTKEELYNKICSLSYNGDLRMRFNMENPHKVADIVNGSFDEFSEMYDCLNHGYYKVENNHLIINKDLLLDEIMRLPSSVLGKIIGNVNLYNLNGDDLEKINFIIEKHIKDNNLKASLEQPIDGTIINGVKKTLMYAKQKKDKNKLYK